MYAKILKANPYHDKAGLFTSKDKATQTLGLSQFRAAMGLPKQTLAISVADMKPSNPGGMKGKLKNILAEKDGPVGKGKYEASSGNSSLNSDNKVKWTGGAGGFAQDYVKGKAGEYRSGGPKLSDNDASEKFYTKYSVERGKSGFGGSGEDVYTHIGSGKKFKVVREANGNGFYGTDHFISPTK